MNVMVLWKIYLCAGVCTVWSSDRNISTQHKVLTFKPPFLTHHTMH